MSSPPPTTTSTSDGLTPAEQFATSMRGSGFVQAEPPKEIVEFLQQLADATGLVFSSYSHQSVVNKPTTKRVRKAPKGK